MHSPDKIEVEFIAEISKNQAILHKICFLYAKNKMEREDLYQEITLQLWKSYPSFKGKAEFSTWMYRVALNTAVTAIKKSSLFIDNRKAIPGLYDLDKSMDYSEDIQILYKAISHLNEVEKAIVLLWLEEKSYHEIAETVGISVKNVSVRLVRIKARLAELIEKIQ